MTLLSLFALQKHSQRSLLNRDVLQLLLHLVFINSSDHQIPSRDTRASQMSLDLPMESSYSHSHCTRFTRLREVAFYHEWLPPLTTWRRKQVESYSLHVQKLGATLVTIDLDLIGTIPSFKIMVSRFAKSNRWLVKGFSVKLWRTCTYMDSTFYTKFSQVS